MHLYKNIIKEQNNGTPKGVYVLAYFELESM